LIEFCQFLISSKRFHEKLWNSLGHHHFGAVGYARAAQVGKGTSSLRG
jgi:hypothetical protein